MPFITIPGLPCKVYVPGRCDRSPRKHECADCFSCQMCADERCRLCRAATSLDRVCGPEEVHEQCDRCLEIPGVCHLDRAVDVTSRDREGDGPDTGP